MRESEESLEDATIKGDELKAAKELKEKWERTIALLDFIVGTLNEHLNAEIKAAN